MFLSLLFAQLYAVEIKDVIANGKNKEKLFDGKTADASHWGVIGEYQNIDIVFGGKETISRMRIYPGIRAYAGFPSTEGGPREIMLYAQKDGKFVKLFNENIKLPRDPQKGNEFFCDIDFDKVETSAVRLEIINSHDLGFRMGSPSKSVASPEQRAVNIREIKFFTAAEVDVQRAAVYAKFAKAAEFLKKYDELVASNSETGKAVKAVWGRRFEELRREIEKGVNPEKIVKDADYLKSQVTPYMSIVNNYKNDNPAFTVKVTNSPAPGTPVEFPIHFGLLEKIIGRKLSHYNISVEAVVNGKNKPARSSLIPLTPNRAKLCWNTVKGAEKYIVMLAFPAVGEAPLMNSAIGNGDDIMFDSFSKSGMSWRIWNIRSEDIFNEGKPAFVTGMWTDYAHIYRNLGTVENPEFHDGAHYFVLDPYDEKIGTTHHHGLAFSLVELADINGDRKIDVILSRSYNKTPIFVKNVSEDNESLDFDHPVEIPSLKSGYRYTYGDLDGDNIADAVGASIDSSNGKIFLGFARGRGLDNTGAPTFEKFADIDLAIPDSTEISRSIDSYFPTPYLRDLNKDGLLDLALCVPSKVYISYNEGSKNSFKFKKLVQMKHQNGKAIDSGFFYPNIGWFDFNGDGRDDFYFRDANSPYCATSDPSVIADKPTAQSPLTKQNKVDDDYLGLAHFVMDDFDNDGNIDFCQQTNYHYMYIYSFEDGMFNRTRRIPFDKYPDAQRFGCCDTTEYGGMYSQITMADFDGDGLKDVLLNNEHNWRLGYYSLYLNNGKSDLLPEIQIAPKKETSHLKTINSPEGKALVVAPETILDYLSFECRDLVNQKAGAIEFTFASDSDNVPPVGRTFFSSWFWNKKQYNNNQLYEVYRTTESMEKYLDKIAPFALVQLPDGKLRLQIGNAFCESAAIELEKGVYHKFEVKWNKNYVKLLMDGKVIASCRAEVPAFAERMHLGSMVWMAIQHSREYPVRRKSHPVDFSTPACGYFENFKLFNADGKESLTLDFENNFGILKNRTATVYRSAPTVIKNYKDGKDALLIQCDDMYRTEMPGNPRARVYIIPFTPVKGKAPVFDEPIPLNCTDGKPFIANSRNNISLYDWDKDGDLDIIFATENNNGEKCTSGVELFLNDGNWNFAKDHNPVFKKLNNLLTAHHDIKLQFAKLTGNDEPDMAIWTDPGFRVYSINYLTQEAPEVVIEEMISNKHEKYFDLEFSAEKNSSPSEAGFVSQGYSNDPSAGGYAGIRESDGKKVFFLDNADPKRKWNNFELQAPDENWKKITIDVCFRLVGSGDKVQFNIGGYVKDPARKSQVAFFSAGFGKKCIAIPTLKEYDAIEGFRRFRIIVDRQQNFYKIYDMDQNGKLAGEFTLMTAPANSKACQLSFGDGSSGVEGQVELEYIKFAFNKTYYPEMQK